MNGSVPALVQNATVSEDTLNRPADVVAHNENPIETCDSFRSVELLWNVIIFVHPCCAVALTGVRRAGCPAKGAAAGTAAVRQL